MKHEPRPFQSLAIEHAVHFLEEAQPGQRQCYYGPTGVGKSVVQIGVRERTGAAIITPRDEIVTGFLEKLGNVDADPDELGLWTPIRLRNRLFDGRVKPPKLLILDETHHETAETWQQLDILTGCAPAVGYTATPYRGTPKGTREFRERWGEVVPIITHQEAADAGYIKLPSFDILPLVDDDVVEVRGGEFSIESLEAATVTRLGDLAEYSRRWHDGTFWDRPTIYAMPSTSICIAMMNELLRLGLPAAIVSAETPKSERWSIFRACEARAIAIIHINVVTEGVDLKLERLVDMAATLSPVKWVQQLGRIERPTTVGTPEYICCCRNLLRHAYALDGIVPVSSLVKAEEAFGPSKRGGGARVLGTEALGRFKAVNLKLTSGLTAHMYSLSTVVERAIVEYSCLVHPNRDAIWAVKVNTVKDGVRTWGKWQECEAPTDLKGFSSVPPRELTDKQRNWWNRSAANFGLDHQQEVNRKNFQALPVLCDTGERL